MSLPWSVRNQASWLAAIVVSGTAAAAIPASLQWFRQASSEEHRTTSKLPSEPLSKPRKVETAVITAEMLQAASTINLQRMNPPIPKPPDPVPVVVEAPKATPSVLFSGSLLGTILDSDPRYSFALLKKTDNQVLLVGQGKPIDDSPNSAKVDEINSRAVTLVRGTESQTLSIPETP